MTSAENPRQGVHFCGQYLLVLNSALEWTRNWNWILTFLLLFLCGFVDWFKLPEIHSEFSYTDLNFLHWMKLDYYYYYFVICISWLLVLFLFLPHPSPSCCRISPSPTRNSVTIQVLIPMSCCSCCLLKTKVVIVYLYLLASWYLI